MTQTAIDTVTAFLAECGKGGEPMRAAFRTYFTPATVWENVGMSTTTGPEEAIQLMDGMGAAMGVAAFRAEMKAIAAAGNHVLTERVDYLIGPDGKDAHALRLMGIFEVADGRITGWRDYFDTAEFAKPQ